MPKKKESVEVVVHPATVSFSLGGTIAKPNFENIKFSVGITIPCSVDQLQKTIRDVEKIVEKEYGKKMDEYR